MYVVSLQVSRHVSICTDVSLPGGRRDDSHEGKFIRYDHS